MKRRDIIVVGVGGHASDVIGLIEDLIADGAKLNLIGVVGDFPPPKPERFENRAEFLGPIDKLDTFSGSVIVALGQPRPRADMVTKLAKYGCTFCTLIHPEARLGTGTTVGTGTVILGGARISPRVRLAEHCFVSYLVGVGHDAVLQAYTSVMPLAAISGDVQIGEGGFIGTHAAILERVRMGAWSVAGAGAVVTKDVADGVTVVGVPAGPKTS